MKLCLKSLVIRAMEIAATRHHSKTIQKLTYCTNTNFKKNGSSCINFRQSSHQSKKSYEKDEHYIMIKQSILQENIRILNVYSSNNMVSN